MEDETVYRDTTIRNTLIQMFNARKYKHDLKELTCEEYIRENIQNDELTVYDGNEVIKVIFNKNIPLSLNNLLNNIIYPLEKKNIKHVILILKCEPTSSVKKIINGSTNLRVELFHEDNLMYNILKYELMPKIEVLSKEGKEKLLKELHVTEDKLQRQFIGDALSLFLGLSAGQVIKITSSSNISGEYVSYRIIIR